MKAMHIPSFSGEIIMSLVTLATMSMGAIAVTITELLLQLKFPQYSTRLSSEVMITIVELLMSRLVTSY